MTGVWKTTAMVVITGLALAGCKTQIATKVTFSELENPDVAEVPGSIRLEVSSCEHYEDSRQPSDSLVKAQEMMPRIFPDAEFQECYRQEFDSWAQFSLPIAIDHSDDGQAASESTVNLLNVEGAPLSVVVPSALSQRIEEAESSASMVGSLDLSMNIALKNDTGEPRPVQAFGVWIDGDPVVLDQFEFAPNTQSEFLLSDVSIAQVRKHQRAPVLLTP